MAYLEKYATVGGPAWWDMWKVIVVEDAEGEWHDVRSLFSNSIRRLVAIPVESVLLVI